MKVVIFDERVTEFREKVEQDKNLVNFGFIVMNPGVLDYIEGDATTSEREPLEHLEADGGLYTYKHEGSWKRMDTQCDKMVLGEMWESGKAPWKVRGGI